MPGKIIALTGPSGVGKDYTKKVLKKRFPRFLELTVLTTRKRRPSDGKDRKTNISQSLFLKMKTDKEIIAAHQPFGAKGDWYGFSKKEVDKLFNSNKTILTEVHPDNIITFKKLYKDKISIIALIAEKEYLENNLKLRESEKKYNLIVRITTARKEIAKIKKLNKKSLIDSVIELNRENRNNLSEIIIKEVKRLL